MPVRNLSPELREVVSTPAADAETTQEQKSSLDSTPESGDAAMEARRRALLSAISAAILGRVQPQRSIPVVLGPVEFRSDSPEPLPGQGHVHPSDYALRVLFAMEVSDEKELVAPAVPPEPGDLMEPWITAPLEIPPRGD